jgi:ATP-binding cassette subfamily C (CFTR/MRP) protein 1
LLALLSVARLAFATLSPKHQSPAVFLSLVSQTLAFLILPALTRHNDLRARRSSTLMLLFWPAYLTGYLIWARTAAATNWARHHQVDFILASIVALLGLFHWAIECFGPEHGNDASQVPNRDPNESAYGTANVYSRWTFHWMDNLMKVWHILSTQCQSLTTWSSVGFPKIP